MCNDTSGNLQTLDWLHKFLQYEQNRRAKRALEKQEMSRLGPL